jgi:hypothetical protein
MINKSLEYVKKRIEEGNCRNMPVEEFKDMYAIPFKSYFLEGRGDYMILAVRKGNDDILADLTYSPDAEFNYFITESCVCDGTLMFMNELMANILKKIGQLQTCYTPAFEGISQEEFNNGNYMIHYEVGDFIANSCIIEPPYKEKPWMCDRFTVMLPVKFSIKKQ